MIILWAKAKPKNYLFHFRRCKSKGEGWQLKRVDASKLRRILKIGMEKEVTEIDGEIEIGPRL